MIKKEGFDFIFDETACQKKCKALCCKGNGYVFLSNKEINEIADYLNIDRETFLKLYTKKAIYGKRIALVDLRINGETRCVFLDDNDRCEIYEKRPKQCRDFPFWKHLSKKPKEELKKLCPGIVYADK